MKKSSRRNKTPAKGWKSPSRSERVKMLGKCGSKCFLLPSELKFPVCNTDCTYNCKGLLAAKIRARQWKYEDVAKKAQKNSLNKSCGWVRKSSKRSPRRRSYTRKSRSVRRKSVRRKSVRRKSVRKSRVPRRRF